MTFCRFQGFSSLTYDHFMSWSFLFITWPYCQFSVNDHLPNIPFPTTHLTAFQVPLILTLFMISLFILLILLGSFPFIEMAYHYIYSIVLNAFLRQFIIPTRNSYLLIKTGSFSIFFLILFLLPEWKIDSDLPAPKWTIYCRCNQKNRISEPKVF